jgi:hypothetical protein
MIETAMGPALTRGEYWILEAVVEVGLPLSWLARESLAEAVNKPAHGLTYAALVSTLDTLFQAGLIEADHTQETVPACLTPAQIELALNEQAQFWEHGYWVYRLTPQGGQVWEAFAQPDWTCFVAPATRTSVDQPALEHGCIGGMQRWWVETYMEALSYLGYAIDSISISWVEQCPWHATYWKVLPAGHEVNYTCMESEHADALPQHLRKVYDYPWYRWR